uniref:Reverse transcriptase zinc-binding domain-containing protein n=1 Tax=Cannabis sativa TaxID=3483 RepID=A0A803QQT2_CANSA
MVMTTNMKGDGDLGVRVRGLGSWECRGVSRVRAVAERNGVMSCHQFQQLLSKYTAASGQLVNYHKSEAYFGRNVTAEVRSLLAVILGVREVENHGKYLGLPSFVGRNKKEFLDEIKNKVWAKMKGWKTSMFSVAGKEVLIKVIVQAIPTYTMSCFKLPKKTISSLHRMASRFWWGSLDKEKKIHWCKWRYLCRPKDKGGLGFRDLGMFNQALLAKQIWRCLRHPQLLCSRVLKASYFPRKGVLEAGCGANASFVWRSLVWGKKLILKGYRWRVGNGESVRVLEDPWLPRPVTFKVYDQPSLPANLYVTDLKLADGQWDEGFIRSIFNPTDVDLILGIPCSDWDFEDKILWHYSKYGEYSVKSGYRMAASFTTEQHQSNEHSIVQWWKKLWRLKIPPKVKHFVWKVAHNWLPANVNLAKRGIASSVVCSRCSSHVDESVAHALWECKASKGYWRVSGLYDDLKQMLGEDNLTMLMRIAAEWDKEKLEFFLLVSWNIWNVRNTVVHGGYHPKPEEMIEWCGNFLADFRGDTGRERSQRSSEDSRWVPPARDQVTINVDAGVKQGGLISGLGYVVRDAAGVVLSAAATVLQQELPPLQLELMAIKKGIQVGIQQRLQRFSVETDCLQAVHLIQNKENGCRDIDGLLNHIRALISYDSFVGISFVFREANRVAHALANYALVHKASAMWIGVIPPCARQAVLFDEPNPM